MKSEFFILKAACLFHDPPTKAWILTGKVTAPDGPEGLKAHEREAYDMAKMVLSNTELDGAHDYLYPKRKAIELADALASSVDRWLLSKLTGGKYSSFRVSYIKLKNVFNPKYEVDVPDEPPIKDGFIAHLNRIIKGVNDVRLAYHVLYACYEPLWIESGLPASPADTRAPSHSVFDHNYATALMMNWLIGREEPKGILLYVDLGGPQRFISSSRKLGDLWTSSYLASALAWKLYWIFIKSLGPDIMVIPTCRGNPFYYHSLISELRSIKVSGHAIDEIKELAKNATGYDPDEYPIPRYAVVPVTATFMLPDVDVLKEFDAFKNIENLNDLENFVEEKYRGVWREVCDGVIEKCKDLEGSLSKLGSKAAVLLEECKKYGFHEVPPLPIRVLSIHTDELYSIGFACKKKEGREEEEEWYKLYYYMFKLLAYRESREKIYRFRPEEELKLYDMTQDLISGSLASWPKKSERGFDYCSVCGKLPAIVIMPSKEEGFEKYGLDAKLEPIFSFGERLCPYCLIKRLINLGEVLEDVMEKLLGKASEGKLIRRFLSVSDIAALPFKESFIKVAQKLDQAPDEEPKDHFSRSMRKVWEEIDKIIKKEGMELKDITREEKPILYSEKELLDIINSVKSEEIKEHLKFLLFLDAEMSLLGKLELREVWRGLLRDLKEKKEYERLRLYADFKRIEPPSTYYAVIRSDADNFGEAIQGKVEKAFRIDIGDYLCNLLEGGAKGVVQAIMEERFDDARRLCMEEKIDNIDTRLNELKRLINELLKEKEILISPSYHSALSRAVMSNALRDVKAIDDYNDYDDYGGLPIYAGGDDLLAVMPVKKCLMAVKKLRTAFSFPSKDTMGFYKMKEYLIPSLATASRSFSVYLAHYMFPMYTVMSRSAELLEKRAKKAKWILCGDGSEKREKDALIFSYSPRGGEQSALLSLNDVKRPDEDLASDIKELQKLIDSIDAPEGDVSFSSSLIYDLQSFELSEHLSYACKHKSDFLLRKALEHLFYRNCNVKGRDESKRSKEAEKWANRLVKNYDLILKVRERKHREKEHPFLKEFITGLMVYRSGLREAI